MVYTWVPIVASRYSDDINNKCMSYWPGWVPKYGCMIWHYQYAVNRIGLAATLTASVVQDFREAVGASLYDEAKDDNTLVPIGCVPSIDAIVTFDLYYITNFCCLKPDGNLDRYLDEDFRDGRRKATIYRRELSGYLKKQLAGEIFPPELPETVQSTPFYTTSRTTNRSL